MNSNKKSSRHSTNCYCILIVLFTLEYSIFVSATHQNKLQAEIFRQEGQKASGLNLQRH